jgi:hypothetical protein
VNHQTPNNFARPTASAMPMPTPSVSAPIFSRRFICVASPALRGPTLLDTAQVGPHSSRAGGERGNQFPVLFFVASTAGHWSWARQYRLDWRAHGKSTDENVKHRQKCRSANSALLPRCYGRSKPPLSSRKSPAGESQFQPLSARPSVGCQANLSRRSASWKRSFTKPSSGKHNEQNRSAA